jgi:hypothetical protein
MNKLREYWYGPHGWSLILGVCVLIGLIALLLKMGFSWFDIVWNLFSCISF